MNKIILLISLLLLTGCGRQTLTCHIEGDSFDTERNMEVRVTFNRAGDLQRRMYTVMNAISGSASTADIHYELFNEDCKDYNSFRGVSCQITRSGNTVTQTVNVNFSRIEEEGIHFFGTADEVTIDQLRVQLLRDGFTCQ